MNAGACAVVAGIGQGGHSGKPLLYVTGTGTSDGGTMHGAADIDPRTGPRWTAT